MRKVLLFIATAALVAAMGGTASAASVSATSLVQENNGNCGKFVEGQPIIGTAKFTRTINKLKVSYKAKHLAKLMTYELEFYNATGGECQFLGISGSAVTTKSGSVTINGEMEVPEKDVEFFVDGFNDFAAPFTNDSFITTIPRP